MLLGVISTDIICMTLEMIVKLLLVLMNRQQEVRRAMVLLQGRKHVYGRISFWI